MYGLGLSTKAIQEHLKDIYNIEVSPELISRVTDEVKGLVEEWRGRWGEVIPFIKFSLEIRKAVYTTNAIESLKYTLQRNLKTRLSFPNNEAAMKLIFMNLAKGQEKVDNAMRNWGEALNQFALIYGDRVPL